MRPPLLNKTTRKRTSLIATAIGGAALVCIAAVVWWLFSAHAPLPGLKTVTTLTGTENDLGEPFGVAVKDGVLFVSDGQNDVIRQVDAEGRSTIYSSGLDTPSALVICPNGEIIVADTGSSTIKKIDATSAVSIVSGQSGVGGFQDGEAGQAKFLAPIGVACGEDGRIFVADTYNDRVRLIKDGVVSTIAGRSRGFADGAGAEARFDSPTSVAIWRDRLLVTDTGNRRIRVVEPDGRVWTLAGNGEADVKDGLFAEASFYQPTAIAVDRNGIIYVADGNTIRRIGGTVVPSVVTITSKWRGLADGDISQARFNRISGLAVMPNGDLIVGDSENRLVRRLSGTDRGTPITADQIAALRDRPEEFRNAAPGRWPYDPPDARRDIAGTLGEIRGEMTPEATGVWFHNGLDIAGAYGETARFIRDEKVLRPIAAENFGTLRELIRLPTIGYVHIRLGRDQANKPFGDPRFQFERDAAGKMVDVRVPRGSRFNAGEPIGTLNAMNHVHLIAGRSGSEMNALDALVLPGVSDSRPPVIETVEFYDPNWTLLETGSPDSRIKLGDKTRIVVRAFDQMDGNPERRRLGVYKLGYQFVGAGGTPVTEPRWTIVFDRMPPNEAVRFAYATGSRSGATGETIFRYIVSNFVSGGGYRESFLEMPSTAGEMTLRVFAADYFGNVSSKDIPIEVMR